MPLQISTARVFPYRPLSTKGNLRLIKLSATQHEDHICFDINEHTFKDFGQPENHVPVLEDQPISDRNMYEAKNRYSALSYHWGDPAPTRIIRLNGIEIKIHENLWQFLRQLRNECDHTLYWTDAICINQHDDADKGHQVSYMDKIYSRASRVVAWLSHDPYQEKYLMVLGSERKVSFPSKWYREKISMQNATSGIAKLTYWRRAWIVQEIALAVSVELKCRQATLPLASFQSSFEKLDKRLQTLHTNLHCSQLLRHVANFNKAKSEYGIPDMWIWLSDLQGLQCQDELDRVYSLIGLVKSLSAHRRGGWPLPEVDYTKSLYTVILDWFFMNLISRTKKRNVAGAEDILLREEDILSLSAALGLREIPTYTKSHGLGPTGLEQLFQHIEDYSADLKVQAEFRWMAECFNMILFVAISPKAYTCGYTPPALLSNVQATAFSASEYSRKVSSWLAFARSRVYCRDKEKKRPILGTFLTMGPNWSKILAWCLGCANNSFCPGILTKNDLLFSSHNLEDTNRLVYNDQALCQTCKLLCQTYFLHSHDNDIPITESATPNREDTATERNLREKPNWSGKLTFSIQSNWNETYPGEVSGSEISVCFGSFEDGPCLPVIYRVYYIDDFSCAERLWNLVDADNKRNVPNTVFKNMRSLMRLPR